MSQTVAGGNSTPTTVGLSSLNYPTNEAPYKGCDNNLLTKNLNFGNCYDTSALSLDCGLRTGFYVTATNSGSLATGLRLCTANDAPTRDPLNVTLEGSNENGTNLILGASWTLIYSGVSGLAVDPGRSTCGGKVFFLNNNTFTSYRLLITVKRGADNSIQLSEFQLIGA